MNKVFGLNDKLAMKIEEDGRVEIINNKPNYLIPIEKMSDVPLPKNKKVRSKKNAENLIKKLSELASLTIAILFVSLFAIICGFAGYFAFNLFITRSWCLCH